MTKIEKAALAGKIRERYVEKERSELDELRDIDRAATRPVKIFSYVLGSIGAIVMGAGMSLIMTDIGSVIGTENAMVPGIITGVIGMIISLVNYPIYQRALASRKRKYADEVINLTNKILNDN